MKFSVTSAQPTRRLAAAAALLASALPVIAFSTEAPASAQLAAGVPHQTVGQVFRYTGAPQTYVVPANVSSLLVQVVGAGGGSVPDGGMDGAPAFGGPGGGLVTTLAVQPGEVIQVNVGGVGQNGMVNSLGDVPVTVPGGWNGGGDVYSPQLTSDAEGEGTSASGGGASDIRVCPSAATGGCGLTDRIAVAGGGGGAGLFDTNNGGDLQSVNGGAGGTFDGQAGLQQGTPGDAGAGAGGTQSQGGSGGTPSPVQGCTENPTGPTDGVGTPGSLGQGGAGGAGGIPESPIWNYTGAGGGGGFYGGGGGACGGYQSNGTSFTSAGSGGGGSSWVDPSATLNTSYWATTTVPQPGWVVFDGVQLGSSLTAQNVMVPAHATSAQITAIGASGGAFSGTPGGGGATVSGVLAGLSSGTSLQAVVGGGGTYVGSLDGGHAQVSGSSFNGGGNVARGNMFNLYTFQGGGGGATDLRICSNPSSGLCPTTSRVIVAAGGGGSTRFDLDEESAPGGAGGCLTGAAGDGDGTSAGPGQGGTQTAGGSGGGPSSSDGDAGQSGAMGAGGAGGIGDDNPFDSRNGSGGGGGYFGGGGGGGGGASTDWVYHSAGAGGGGSSLTPAGFTCTAGTSGAPNGSIDGSMFIGFPIIVPGMPRTVAAESTSAISATVSWRGSLNYGADITGYRVEWSTRDGRWSAISPGGADGRQLPPTTRSFLVTGLPAATAVHFRVRALSAAGPSPAAITSMVHTGAIVPSPPTGVAATPVANGLDVTWSPPTNDGGAVVTGFEVRWSSDQGQTWSAPSLATTTELSVADLDGTLSYQVEVSATNEAGTGGWSEPSPAAQPLLVPSPPSQLTQSPLVYAVTLSWTPPALDPGMVLDGYRYRISPDGGTTWSNALPTGSADPTVIVHGVGRSSWVEVQSVVNTVTSGWSAPLSLSPITRSSPPRGVHATPGTGAVILAWTSPADPGGGALSGYAIEQRTSGGRWSTVVPSTNSLSTSYAVGNLATGTHYEFAVRALSSSGPNNLDSWWSDASPAVVPGVVPNAPGRPELSRVAGHWRIHWLRPAADGGYRIRNYRIEVAVGASAWTTVAKSHSTSAVIGLPATRAAVRVRVVAVNSVGLSPPSLTASPA